MKQPLIVVLMLAGLTGYAKKDPCSQIRTTADNVTGARTLKSPDLKNITVIKQFRTDTFFALLLHFTTENPHFDSWGARIVFEDGTVIDDETVAVKCVQESSALTAGAYAGGAVNSGKYMVQGFFRITDATAVHFMLSKIASVSLHNATKLIPPKEATKVMEYVQCMK